MSKYKLINLKTKEEHLCDRWTINGIDYYVKEYNIKKEGQYCIDSNISIFKSNINIFKDENYYPISIGQRMILCTNNPNIDIPKVVDKVEILADNYFNSNYAWIKNVKAPYSDTDVELIKNNYKEGYNKSQETHSFSEEDMKSFGKFCAEYDYRCFGSKTQEEMLDIWKEQQPKIIYYE